MAVSPVKGKVAVIANPESGGGSGRAKIREFIALLRGKNVNFQLFVTRAPGDAVGFGSEIAAASDFDCVLILGGDGTLSEAAKGLHGTQIPVATIPCGSGNDMAGALGIPRDLEKALEVVEKADIVTIDLFKDGDTIYVETIGCGFVAEVVARVLKLSRFIHGSPAYFAAVLDTLARFKFADYKIVVDGEEWQGSASLVIVNNSWRVGGGMKLTPQARLDDGLLDICIVTTTSKTTLLSLLPKAYSGGHVHSPYVTIRQGKNITIETDRVMTKTADGEIVGTLPIKTQILPAAMNFFRAPQLK